MSAHSWRDALARLRHDRTAVAAAALLALIAVVAVLAPLLAPYDPSQQHEIVLLKNRPPSLEHPFGTDPYSRDVLSRVLWGARVSLGVAALAVALSSTLGLVYGAIAGYVGGAVDAVMMRVVDGLLSIPTVLLLIVILSLWGAVPLVGLVVILGATGWFGVSRLVRAEVASVKHREFIAAGRALGLGHARLVLRHVLPHVLAPLLVTSTLSVANVIVLEAGLSYLGIGIRPPEPSWGNIIRDGADAIHLHWWVSVFPGLALVMTTLAVNVLADGLRDALDPRQLPGR